MTDTAPAIELKGISKAFGPVQANKDIDIRVMPGTIHGIIGENGAGKSTLMSILYGFYEADSGRDPDRRHGQLTRTSARRALQAIEAGIGMVHPAFHAGADTMSVVENIMLGAEDPARILTLQHRWPRPAPSWSGWSATSTSLERRSRGPDRSDLPVGHAAAGRDSQSPLSRQAEILILDEPTGVLTPAGDGPAVPYPRFPESREGVTDHSHYPQAARDHGDHRPRFSVMRRRRDGGRPSRRRKPARRNWPS